MADIDSVEYYFKNGVETPLAFIDYKHGSAASVSVNYSPMRLQLNLANMAGLPFFIGITYLHEAEPCYYLMAVNEKANELFHSYGISKSDRAWFTIKEFSKFLYFMRNEQWNGFEVDSNTGETLNELPDTLVTYKLPKIDLYLEAK